MLNENETFFAKCEKRREKVSPTFSPSNKNRVTRYDNFLLTDSGQNEIICIKYHMNKTFETNQKMPLKGFDFTLGLGYSSHVITRCKGKEKRERQHIRRFLYVR